MRSPIAFVGLVVIAGVSLGQEATETITVSASVTVFVRPDTARIHFSVGTTELALDTAKEATTKQAEATTAALKSLKLDNLTTSAGTLTYSQRQTLRGGGGFGGPNNPNGNPAPPAVQTSYYARQPISVTVRDTDPSRLTAAVDQVLRKLIDSGAAVTVETVDEGFGGFGGGGPGGRPGGIQRVTSSSQQIEWLVADDTAARKDAYRAAVRKARASAEAISKEIGWNTLKIVSVVDGASTPEPAQRAPAGEVPVTARVTLKCSR